jgi:hypothetical protein
MNSRENLNQLRSVVDNINEGFRHARMGLKGIEDGQPAVTTVALVVGGDELATNLMLELISGPNASATFRGTHGVELNGGRRGVESALSFFCGKVLTTFLSVEDVAVKQAWDAVVEALATRDSKKQKIEEPPPLPKSDVGRMGKIEFDIMKIDKEKQRLAATWDACEVLQLALESAREQVRNQALLLGKQAEKLKELEHLQGLQREFRLLVESNRKTRAQTGASNMEVKYLEAMERLNDSHRAEMEQREAELREFSEEDIRTLKAEHDTEISEMADAFWTERYEQLNASEKELLKYKRIVARLGKINSRPSEEQRGEPSAYYLKKVCAYIETICNRGVGTARTAQQRTRSTLGSRSLARWLFLIIRRLVWACY